jgi:hypothetical protein
MRRVAHEPRTRAAHAHSDHGAAEVLCTCHATGITYLIRRAFAGCFAASYSVLRFEDYVTDSTCVGTQSCPPPGLPNLIPEQMVPIASSDKTTQRLIVVLSNASLEVYKSSGGAKSVKGPGREEKFHLLNSDEHIGVMRKIGRDISEARPDITHQVRDLGARLKTTNIIVSSYTTRFSDKQSWQAPDLHTYCEQCAYRSKPNRTNSSNIQTICWTHGPTTSPTFNSVDNFG